MKSMAVKRREACPQTVLHLWDAVAYIRQQKQVPNHERLSAYMKRVYNLSSEDFEKQLNFAVEDGLLLVKKRVGCKGSKVGIEEEGFHVPDEIQARDGHDWYCFECHQGGEVLLCSTCHRVYHEDCLAKSPDSNFVCPLCSENSERFSMKDIKKSELNMLLSFTCIRLKEKTRELHRIPHPDEEKWRYNFLIYEPMDLVAMEDKMKSNEYDKLGDFYSDAQQVVHNIVVYFGTNSRIAEMARQMLGDCEYDLLEILQCRSCYKMSNMKNDNFWFCQPCNPPHELVYAKVKGFPYWPGKVIRKEDGFVDVRFFGAFHQRALVHEDYVKPVTTSFQTLGIKKTPSFDRAYKELKRHQDLVEASLKGNSSTPKVQNDKPPEVSTRKRKKSSSEDTLSSSKPKSPASRKRKSLVSTPVAKPSPIRKPASVPVKKNKKFYQESTNSSSPTNNQDSPVAEDHNIVSSSSQDTSVYHVSIGVQTSDELLKPEIEASNQQNGEVSAKAQKACDCSAKYEKLMKELHIRLEEEHKADKAKHLKEFSDKIRLELEAEQQKSLAVALDKLQHDHKDSQRKAEEQRKVAHQQDVKKLLEQHAIEISEVKKKQWCYNCEAEAIYHCCWNTSYCSVECQQVHWHKEHKRTCRRKR